MEVEKISANESKFIFSNSTPTIGKLLQTELLRDPNVTFAGYSCPHPLETRMIVTVITSDKNPREVVTNTLNSIIIKLDALDIAVKSFKSSD